MKKVNFVKFSVVHDNCWTALTENTDVRVQTVNESFQDKVYEAELVLWGRDVKKFMRELKENVLQLEVYGEKTKFLKCVCKRENSISDLVKKSKGTMVFQFNRDGVEEWGIIIDNKKVEEFRANLEQISTLTKFNVMDLEDVLVYPDLSASQLKVLSHAYKKGYFSFPKGTNVRELAKDLEISPVTLLYHLKRGEDAIIGHYLNLIK